MAISLAEVAASYDLSDGLAQLLVRGQLLPPLWPFPALNLIWVHIGKAPSYSYSGGHPSFGDTLRTTSTLRRESPPHLLLRFHL